MQFPPVTLAAAYSNKFALVCPRCGSENLHHKVVTVFDRSEDDKDVLVTTANTAETKISIESPCMRNPSSRRDGIAISFMCECCDGDPSSEKEPIELAVEQHKGTTYIGWRDTQKT